MIGFGSIRLSPAIRLSIGLVMLMLSMLILAQALGLAPSADKQQLEARKQLAEALSKQISLAIERGDDLLLKYFIDGTVQHNPDILSAAVRTNEGILVAQTSEHEQNWAAADPVSSTPTHLRLPLLVNGSPRANLELSFKPLISERHPLFHLPIFVVTLVFLSVSGFVAFWFYIRRVLQHLDPSAVVPARVRNAMNVLAEGVLILDRREQIVLANNAILSKLKRNEKNLLGKKASSLGWHVAEEQEAKVLPWLSALKDGVKQTGVRVELSGEDEKPMIFSVNAVPIMDGESSMQGAIAVFDDVSELEEKSRLLEEILAALAKSQAEMEAKNKELRYLAVRDPLTDCFNRRALYEHLEPKFGGARQTDAEYSCIMADIDHFKRVNDTYGHNIGDDVIRMAARCIQSVVRDGDIVARFGGEEFCIILPGTPLEQACAIAERCREKIAAEVTNGVSVTSSFGVTARSFGAASANELIHQADQALYYSKQRGRNRVSHWAQMEPAANS